VGATYLRMLCRLSRDARLVLGSTALQAFGAMGIYGVLLNLYMLRLGYGAEFIGLVNASGTLTAGICCLPASAVGQRWGSRRAMIGGLSIAALSHSLLPLAGLLQGQARAAVLIGVSQLAYLGFATRTVNFSPFLMSAAGPEERNYAFSMSHAIAPGAAFLGSLTGGFLPGAFSAILGVSIAGPLPYGLSLFVASLFQIPAVLLLLATHEVPAAPRARARSDDGGRLGGAPIGLVAAMALVLFVRVAGDGSVRTFFNVYMDAGLGVPTTLIGTFLAMGQLLAIPAALATPVLAARWGNAHTYVMAALGMALCLLPLALIPRWEAAAVGYIGMTSLLALARPAVTVYHQSLVPSAWRPAMAGGIQMGVAFGWAAMAYGGGYIIRLAGYHALFLVGAALIACGALLFWGYSHTPRGEFAHKEMQRSLAE